MIVADLAPAELRRRLSRGRLNLRTGPVVSRIRSTLDEVVDGIRLHYAQHPIEEDEGFADFHVGVERRRGVRRWWRPQVVFRLDGESPFAPLPGDQGFPMLEWGLNWCVSSQCHGFLILHAAVLAREGRAVVLPAPSGSGKSTLCAALMFAGWRLLSDELTLIDPRTGHVMPLPRPVSLKNASIDAIRAHAPQAVIGPVVRETSKGSVAHLRPAVDAVRRAAEPAAPAWLVVPRYIVGADAVMEPLPKARAFMRLVDNAFNYHLHGRSGFDTLARLVDTCECRTLTYGRLAEAIAVVDRLTG